MIIIIDNYDSFTYNLYQMVAMKEAVKVVRNDVMTVDEILGLDPSGIIISPGPGRPEEAGICLDLIRAASGTIPLLGVCLGCQAIAMAFGGKVIRAAACVHGKPEMVFHHRQGLFSNLSLPFQAGRYHSLVVEKASLPKTIIVEAETINGIPMAIRHIAHPTFGVQFHPESILTPDGEGLMSAFLLTCQKKETIKC